MRHQPNSRQRASAESRASILEAAGRIFARQGLSGARTEAIAAEAGVNKALLYYYFKSKEDLYWAVLDEAVTDFHLKALTLLSQEGAAPPIVLQYVSNHFDFIAAHPHYPRLFQMMMMAGGRRCERLVAERIIPVAQKLDALLRRGIRRGELRRLDPSHTAVSLVALTVFYFNAAPVIRLVSGQDPFTPASMLRRKAEVLRFIRYALLTGPEATVP
jgi:TetR/AcrR family transcriptional regulator